MRKLSDLKLKELKLAMGISKETLDNESGEAYLDMVMKILIIVVIGALLLGILYALFGDTVFPMLKDKITDLFNYQG